MYMVKLKAVQFLTLNTIGLLGGKSAYKKGKRSRKNSLGVLSAVLYNQVFLFLFVKGGQREVSPQYISEKLGYQLRSPQPLGPLLVMMYPKTYQSTFQTP
jgi:hypothetical protein